MEDGHSAHRPPFEDLFPDLFQPGQRPFAPGFVLERGDFPGARVVSDGAGEQDRSPCARVGRERQGLCGLEGSIGELDQEPFTHRQAF